MVIAQSTFEIAGALFECTDLGAQTLKGFDDPMNAWRVNSSRVIDSRFEATRKQMLTPFVGRDEEIGILNRRWQHACAGKGQVVLLSGEAGIGKSRIIHVLEEHIGTQSCVHLRFQCSPYHSNSALYPVIGQIERAAGFRPEDNTDERLDKLEALVETAGCSNGEMIPLIAPLLTLQMGDRYGAHQCQSTTSKEIDVGGIGKAVLRSGRAEASAVPL